VKTRSPDLLTETIPYQMGYRKLLLSWPPSDESLESWISFYRVRLEDAGDVELVRAAAEHEFSDQHPYVARFHGEAVELAIKRASGLAHWRDVDRWTRLDFIDHVRRDQRDGRSGSKRSIATRAEMSASALWRRWERVREIGEAWPSARKGPAVRR